MDALQGLVGHTLSAVEFVEDYLQLRFDGGCISSYTQPTISWGDESLTWGQPGYRDALCRQIGCRVEHAEVAEGQYLSIAFENGALISISLRDDDYGGPEALQFRNDDGGIWVV